MHLLHGAIIEMKGGDILGESLQLLTEATTPADICLKGHEFCGVVESVGSKVTDVKVGDRVVASFQIACGASTF